MRRIRRVQNPRRRQLLESCVALFPQERAVSYERCARATTVRYRWRHRCGDTVVTGCPHRSSFQPTPRDTHRLCDRSAGECQDDQESCDTRHRRCCTLGNDDATSPRKPSTLNRTGFFGFCACCGCARRNISGPWGEIPFGRPSRARRPQFWLGRSTLSITRNAPGPFAGASIGSREWGVGSSTPSLDAHLSSGAMLLYS